MDAKTRSVLFLYGAAVSILCLVAALIPRGAEVLLINGNHSAFQDEFFKAITHLGSGVIFIVPVLAFLFVQFRLALVGVLVGVLHGVLVSILKRWIFPFLERPRNVLNNELLYFVPGVEVHGLHAFPSGHTATIFALSMFISLATRDRRVALLMLTISLLVAYSRIYLLEHFLLDVAGGSVVGVVTAWLLWLAYERTNLLQSPSLAQRLVISTSSPDARRSA
jgi:membrane-associated phospholipid phosphatase